MRASRTRCSVFAALGLVAVTATAPRAAAGQEVVPALVGGAAGLAAGGYVSVGVWTAKARFRDEYLFSAADALGWEAAPIVLGIGTGAALGYFDQDRLRRTVIGGGAGFLVGTGIGMTLGAAHWRLPEGRWAGGIIGGAAGILLGSAVGALWPDDDEAASPEAAAARGPRIPIGITLHF